MQLKQRPEASSGQGTPAGQQHAGAAGDAQASAPMPRHAAQLAAQGPPSHSQPPTQQRQRQQQRQQQKPQHSHQLKQQPQQQPHQRAHQKAHERAKRAEAFERARQARLAAEQENELARQAAEEEWEREEEELLQKVLALPSGKVMAECWASLPPECTSRVLACPPPGVQALTARRLSKAHRQQFEHQVLITHGSDELPLWALAAQLQRIKRLTRAASVAAQQQLIARVAASGRIDQLVWLRRLGCEWAVSLCYEAAAAGQLAVLQWARARAPPCPWDGGIWRAALDAKQLEVLAWLRGQDYSDQYSSNSRRLKGDLYRELCRSAARHSQEETLQLLGVRQPWPPAILYSAALGGQLGLLQRAHEHMPGSWMAGVCGGAALVGHLHILAWARGLDPPAPWDESVCANAAWNTRNGLEVLQWLRAQEPPCPWDGAVRDAAWRSGQPEIADWAEALGCPRKSKMHHSWCHSWR